ncbi:MAG TPA: NAD(P)-dependent oxidoreductase, partial [Acidimicrobiales bacterium]|nr:NAD(P)-dependent oxidoreductase [Acidimicrobiales bacterium]
MRLLTQVGGRVADELRAAVDGLEVIEVPANGPVDPGVRGEALVATHRSDNLMELAGREVAWVHFFGTGVDGLPPGLFSGRVVTCSRGAGAVPISEWVLGVMLAFEKRLPESWIHSPPEGPWGWARLGGLAGRTLGLVGLGGIGQAVASRALAFDMEVVALRRRELPSPLRQVEVVQELGELLGRADHLVVAAPHTARTHRLLDRRAFAQLRPGAHLVNVARGPIVDQEALRQALDSGRVALASLDVCDPEP